jgi:hypothetical protein
MGKLADLMKPQAPISNQQAPMSTPQGGMGGMQFKGAQGITNIPVVAAEAAATATARTTATEQAKLKIQKEQDLELLSSVSSIGKPYSEVNLDDAMTVFNGNLDTAKKFIDLKKSFQETEPTKKKIDMVVPIVEQIIRMSKSIPSAEGLSGRGVQATNWLQGKAGYSAEMTTIGNMIKMIRPMIVKAMGDSGNLNIQEQKTGVAVLEQIPSGTTKERELGVKMFKMIMEKGAGRSWDKVLGETKKATHKDLDDDELMNMLQNYMKGN